MPATVALPVLAFLASLGVVTKTDQGYNYLNYIPALQYLGVRQVRDGISETGDLIAMHQQAGVSVDLIGASGLNLSGLLSAGDTLAAAGALTSFEGANEPGNQQWCYPDAQHCGGGGGSWLPVAQYQAALYQGVKNDPVLTSYPVLTASELGAEVVDVGMQWLTIPAGAGVGMPDGTVYADYDNLHNYVSGNCHQYLDNVAWFASAPKLNGCWDGVYGSNVITWYQKYPGYKLDQIHGLPRATTETGWDSVSDPGGEDVQGKVLTNVYLDQFHRGYRWTYIYELGNGEGGGGNQGLFENDWTPKLAATYIHNLTSILADPGPPQTPGSLAYGIPSQPATVHHMLMQKSNGVFELAVWGEQVSGSNDITVKFGGGVSGVNVYDVTLGTTPVATYANVKSIPLTMSDHAMIVEVTP